ncbi:WSC domain-containing protein [Phanerochaete sordida]|uniref:WSC domain-containing protein n=1 Tax=Phanerochaete sordida TaxID=48140 RepID=A0A9P3LAP5_9APHY|nr:WSC domain-containing protein [Phanerochaete sordida]
MLLTAFSLLGAASLHACGVASQCTAPYTNPICAEYIRPYSDNAYVWQHICRITPPADTSILMAAQVERFDDGYPCNPSYTMTCCAQGEVGCAVWGDCVGPETAPPVPYYPPVLAPGWSVAEPCAVDNAARVLAGITVMYLPGNTPYDCTAQCGAHNYAYAGVEYGDECYCGTGYAGGAAPPAANLSDCSMMCAGDYTNACGGSWRMQIYKFN